MRSPAKTGRRLFRQSEQAEAFIRKIKLGPLENASGIPRSQVGENA